MQGLCWNQRFSPAFAYPKFQRLVNEQMDRRGEDTREICVILYACILDSAWQTDITLVVDTDLSELAFGSRRSFKRRGIARSGDQPAAGA